MEKKRMATEEWGAIKEDEIMTERTRNWGMWKGRKSSCMTQREKMRKGGRRNERDQQKQGWSESMNSNTNQCNRGVSCQAKGGLAALFQISTLVSATSYCLEFLGHILRSPKPHWGIFSLCSHWQDEKWYLEYVNKWLHHHDCHEQTHAFYLLAQNMY